MRKILLAAALAAIATAAPAADHACVPVKLTCGGSEPFWSFRLPGNNTVRFSDPANPNWQKQPLVLPACAHPDGSGYVITAGAPLNLNATVRKQRCVEENDRVRRYSISISYVQGADGGTQTQVSGPGCCWR
jgi:uncharacterized membrane protein